MKEAAARGINKRRRRWEGRPLDDVQGGDRPPIHSMIVVTSPIGDQAPGIGGNDHHPAKTTGLPLVSDQLAKQGCHNE